MTPPLLLLLQLVASANIILALTLVDDNRAVSLWGFNYTFDGEVFSTLELHPASGETVTNEITGKITLASDLDCDIMIHRYVIAHVPWGIVEFSVKETLDEIQDTNNLVFGEMGLPNSCPVPAGEYPLHWIPRPSALMPDRGSSGTYTVGLEAVDSDQTLFNGSFTLKLQRTKS